MADLTGRTALVTGGGTGIGRAVALAVADAGARVVVCGRREDPLEETVRSIRDAGGTASALIGDVAVEPDVEAIVEYTIATHGSLDLACNNAATEGILAPITDLATVDFDRTLATNLRGVFLCMKHEARAMLSNGGGAIVNVSSVNAVRPEPTASAYCASKAALESLTQTAALEWADRGIRVNAVRPGFVLTPMHDRANDARGDFTPEAIAEVEAIVPVKRRAEPSEIANAVLWLMSDEAAYVTASILTIDGGVSYV